MTPSACRKTIFRQAVEASRKEAECRCFRAKAYVGTPMGEKNGK